MSAKAIWYDENERRFYFSGFAFTSEKLGRLIAGALMNGSEQVDINFPDGERIMTVTVNYLTQMMRFSAKEGWFWDCAQDTADHKFNPNSPTPGSHWGEAQEYLAEAREHFQVADRLFHSGSLFERLRAYQEEGKGQRLQLFALRRQHPGVSGRHCS